MKKTSSSSDTWSIVTLGLSVAAIGLSAFSTTRDLGNLEKRVEALESGMPQHPALTSSRDNPRGTYGKK